MVENKTFVNAMRYMTEEEAIRAGFHWTGNNNAKCDASHKHEWTRYGKGWCPEDYGLKDFTYCEICGMPEDYSNQSEE